MTTAAEASAHLVGVDSESRPALEALASQRKAMRLPPDRYWATPIEDAVGLCPELAPLGTHALSVIAEDPFVTAERRLAAAALLALSGDPRINPLSPALVDVAAGEATIGTEPESVETIVARWRDVGVTTEWIAKEVPLHTAAIAGFRIGRYPVTNLEYREFLADSGYSELPTSWRFGVFPVHLANHPVWTVSYEASTAYTHWLTDRTNRRFRLPTEYEWEYAASGGDGRQYPWGERFDPWRANTAESGHFATTAVGIHPRGRSPFGVDDMAGNVEEWVSDLYRPYPGGQFVDDDLSERASEYRVTRGGCFSRFGDLARCQRRHGWIGGDIYAVGFRLVEHGVGGEPSG